MATLSFTSSQSGTAFYDIIGSPDIVPGDVPSYETCKQIYLYHPLGKKLVEAPITMAQSQPRNISIPKGPEETCREAFMREWVKLNADGVIFDVMRLSRMYGVSTLAVMEKGKDPSSPLKFEDLYKSEISFNRFDPLNTAGSLVLDQDPNSYDFLKQTGVTVNGTKYHRSRTMIQFHESPIYISYVSSGFGYVGRSVYQRVLFPLKTFLQSMITDDLILMKAGVLVAKMKPAGSITDNPMLKMFGIKRNFVKEAINGNVLSITPDEAIETLDFTNMDGPTGQARKNVLENIAAGNDMPAQILNSETFAQGFADGTEDAKKVARYVQRFRTEMKELYDFMDRVCMYRAWNPDFYKEVIQAKFPKEYGKVKYETAFYEWSNSFSAEWPNLLEEPDSEKSKVSEIKLKNLIETVAELKADMDPRNKAALIQWLVDNMNEDKQLFTTPLQLDYDTLAEYTPPQVSGLSGSDEEKDSELKTPKPPKIPQLSLAK